MDSGFIKNFTHMCGEKANKPGSECIRLSTNCLTADTISGMEIMTYRGQLLRDVSQIS